MKYGHWDISNVGDFSINDWFGFIYEISNKTTGKLYIGKKNFFFKKTLPPLKGKIRKRKIVYESDWKDYISSSENLKNDVDLIGREGFEFHILWLCSGKSELTFMEMDIQHKRNILTELMENGERRYYNKTIANKHFAGVDVQTNESRRKTSIALKEYWKDRIKAPMPDEVREKISKAIKEKWKNKEYNVNNLHWSGLSKQQLSENASYAAKQVSPENRRKSGIKAGHLLFKNKKGIFGYTKEEKKELCIKGGKSTGKLPWWTDGEKSKRCVDCPGDGWKRGRAAHKKKKSLN